MWKRGGAHIPPTTTLRMVVKALPPLVPPWRTSLPAYHSNRAHAPTHSAYVKPKVSPLANPACFPSFNVVCNCFEYALTALVSPTYAYTVRTCVIAYNGMKSQLNLSSQKRDKQKQRGKKRSTTWSTVRPASSYAFWLRDAWAVIVIA